jgi:hypothetical protein
MQETHERLVFPPDVLPHHHLRMPAQLHFISVERRSRQRRRRQVVEIPTLRHVSAVVARHLHEHGIELQRPQPVLLTFLVDEPQNEGLVGGQGNRGILVTGGRDLNTA